MGCLFIIAYCGFGGTKFDAHKNEIISSTIDGSLEKQIRRVFETVLFSEKLEVLSLQCHKVTVYLHMLCVTHVHPYSNVHYSKVLLIREIHFLVYTSAHDTCIDLKFH